MSKNNCLNNTVIASVVITYIWKGDVCSDWLCYFWKQLAHHKSKKGWCCRFPDRILLNCKNLVILPSSQQSHRQSDPSPNPWIIRCSPIYGKALQLLFFSINIHYRPTNLETVACVPKPFTVGHLRNVFFGVLAVQGTQSSVEAKK